LIFLIGEVAKDLFVFDLGLLPECDENGECLSEMQVVGKMTPIVPGHPIVPKISTVLLSRAPHYKRAQKGASSLRIFVFTLQSS